MHLASQKHISSLLLLFFTPLGLSKTGHLLLSCLSGKAAQLGNGLTCIINVMPYNRV